MLVTFWVHGRGKDEAEPLGWIKGIWFNVEENLRWVGGYMGVSEPYQPGQTPSEVVSPVKQEPEASLGGGWFSGLAGSLRGGVATRSGESKRGLPPPGTYKIGEVKAEYVKVSHPIYMCLVADKQNASGQFTLLSLIVDVPNSRAAYPGKAVVYWSPEADTEGLMSKRR
jgi:import inner membrane translocase subunit TIM21